MNRCIIVIIAVSAILFCQNGTRKAFSFRKDNHNGDFTDLVSLIEQDTVGIKLLKDCNMSIYKSFRISGSIFYAFIVDMNRNTVFREKRKANGEELKHEVTRLLK